MNKTQAEQILEELLNYKDFDWWWASLSMKEQLRLIRYPLIHLSQG